MPLPFAQNQGWVLNFTPMSRVLQNPLSKRTQAMSNLLDGIKGHENNNRRGLFNQIYFNPFIYLEAGVQTAQQAAIRGGRQINKSASLRIKSHVTTPTKSHRNDESSSFFNAEMLFPKCPVLFRRTRGNNASLLIHQS